MSMYKLWSICSMLCTFQRCGFVRSLVRASFSLFCGRLWLLLATLRTRSYNINFYYTQIALSAPTQHEHIYARARAPVQLVNDYYMTCSLAGGRWWWMALVHRIASPSDPYAPGIVVGVFCVVLCTCTWFLRFSHRFFVRLFWAIELGGMAVAGL